jgi:hypothetical protein
MFYTSYSFFKRACNGFVVASGTNKVPLGASRSSCLVGDFLSSKKNWLQTAQASIGVLECPVCSCPVDIGTSMSQLRNQKMSHVMMNPAVLHTHAWYLMKDCLNQKHNRQIRKTAEVFHLVGEIFLSGVA